MAFSILDFFFKAKANPAFGAVGPGDVAYTFKGDPAQAIEKFGTTEPFKKPSFSQYLLAPESAGRTSQINQEFGLRPMEAEQTMGIQEKLQKRKTALDLFDIGAKAEDTFNRVKEQAPWFSQQKLGDRKAQAQLDFDIEKEQANWRTQEAANRTKAIADAEAKARQENEKLKREIERKENSSYITQLRSSGALPDQLREYSDEQIADMVGQDRSNANLLKEAEASADIKSGVTKVKSEQKISELQYKNKLAQNLGTEEVAKGAALTAMPDVVQNTANKNLLGKQFEAETGLPLGAAATALNIPRISQSGVQLDKGLVQDPLEELLANPTLGGKEVLGPDGKPLQKRRPSWLFNPTQNTQSVTNVSPTFTAEQSAAPVLRPTTSQIPPVTIEQLQSGNTQGTRIPFHLRQDAGFTGLLNTFNPISPYNILNMIAGNEGNGMGMGDLYVAPEGAVPLRRTHKISNNNPVSSVPTVSQTAAPVLPLTNDFMKGRSSFNTLQNDFMRLPSTSITPELIMDVAPTESIAQRFIKNPDIGTLQKIDKDSLTDIDNELAALFESEPANVKSLSELIANQDRIWKARKALRNKKLYDALPSL